MHFYQLTSRNWLFCHISNTSPSLSHKVFRCLLQWLLFLSLIGLSCFIWIFCMSCGTKICNGFFAVISLDFILNDKQLVMHHFFCDVGSLCFGTFIPENHFFVIGHISITKFLCVASYVLISHCLLLVPEVLWLVSVFTTIHAGTLVLSFHVKWFSLFFVIINLWSYFHSVVFLWDIVTNTLGS